MNTVLVVPFRWYAKDPNPSGIFTLFDRALITEDNPFLVCFISILILFGLGKILSNIVFSQERSLFRPPLSDVLLGEYPLDSTYGHIGGNLVGQLAKRQLSSLL
jgi:hypothetical protein